MPTLRGRFAVFFRFHSMGDGSMSDDGSNLAASRAANSPNGFDLRRVGAHPDYWYPVAWSDELKTGRALGRRFAGVHGLGGDEDCPSGEDGEGRSYSGRAVPGQAAGLS